MKKGAGNPLRCMQCGSCTSACPVNTIREDFNPRRMVGSIARFNRLPDQDPWLCSTCSLCTDRCPQAVNPFSIIMALRAVVYENGGEAPAGILRMVEQVRETGLALPLTPESLERRRLLGLPEVGLSSEGLSEVRRILSEAGFK
ncbi:MAG: 4Fe-4S dicluster domain-containing protein [Thermoproteota archaeon]|nr:4Fe-4S dicluster domain-containing protein [Candidatus Brockarchaeota archaeon]